MVIGDPSAAVPVPIGPRRRCSPRPGAGVSSMAYNVTVCPSVEAADNAANQELGQNSDLGGEIDLPRKMER